jgi:hypothetical protein
MNDPFCQCGPPQNVLKAHGAALTAFPGREKVAAVPKMRGSDRRSKCGPPPKFPVEGGPNRGQRSGQPRLAENIAAARVDCRGGGLGGADIPDMR